MLITALILVLSLGIAYSAAGAVTFEVGGVTVALSGLAVGSVVGIVLNIILPARPTSTPGTEGSPPKPKPTTSRCLWKPR